ncbi:MAG: hypothetical protein QOD64_330 [Verrucomicrobiota bacterium]|jgi:hypothetical protein
MSEKEDQLIDLEGERFCLAIPLSDAVAFALGWSDLGCPEPTDIFRQVIGHLAIDGLQYTEQWRAAALVRECLVEKWPGFEA